MLGVDLWVALVTIKLLLSISSDIWTHIQLFPLIRKQWQHLVSRTKVNILPAVDCWSPDATAFQYDSAVWGLV